MCVRVTKRKKDYCVKDLTRIQRLVKFQNVLTVKIEAFIQKTRQKITA